MDADEGLTELGWWVISGEQLMELLQRVEKGETPDAVYMEEYANAHEHEVPG